MSKPRFRPFAAALVVAALGCGGAPKPEARIASSQGAIRGAEEAGAQTVPRATLHLKLAEEQRAKALELVKNDDNHRAELMLARAEADAELALALAREASAAAEAEKVDEELEVLSKQVEQAEP
jgi:5'-3' exonuclease